MRLNWISLPVHDLQQVAGFYRDTLGLRVSAEADTAVVTVGRSQLEVRRVQTVPSAHHLAFTTPAGTLAAARYWVTDRTHLLTRGDQDEFEGPGSWNSRSLYFDGPEGTVLEIIERRDLPGVRIAVGEFSADDLVCISEVGVAVPDVIGAVELLRDQAGLPAYGEPPAAEFAAVGDPDGLLILALPGRPWLPTTDRRVGLVPAVVVATGPRSGSYLLGDTELRVEP